MSKVFLFIYDWFSRHTRILYAVLAVSVALFLAMATQISLQENITNFFGQGDKKDSAIFEKLQAKDKIVVMLSGDDPDAVIEAADVFEGKLRPLLDEGLIRSVTSCVDSDAVGKCAAFIYGHLPIFLTDKDYAALEQRVTDEAIDQAARRAYQQLTSPSGMVVGDILLRDPLGIGTHLLQAFERFNPDLQYEIYGGRLFTKDLSTMLIFIEPSYGMGDTGRNDRLVSLLEQAGQEAGQGGIRIDCIGGPIVAVHNARQIKRDTTITLGIALVFILTMIWFSFRNRWSIPLILAPPAFGALFAFALVWLIQGEISAIAIGAGSVVLGISLSYSIHAIAHLNHTSSPRKIIEELATPLTIGSFTTIAAFAALMFTSSSLLQDMGMFAVFVLVGTTLFCLVFLPHFLKGYGASGSRRLLGFIEQGVGYSYDTNKWIILAVLAAVVTALFFCQDVRFNDDVSKINFVPAHIQEAEQRAREFSGNDSRAVYIVTAAEDVELLTAEYARLEATLEHFRKQGCISNISTVSDFAISPALQAERIARWNAFWEQHRRDTMEKLDRAALQCGFREHAFSAFEELISRPYTGCGYSHPEIGDVPALSEWIGAANGSYSLLSRITIEEQYKPVVYQALSDLENSAVVDRAYFSARMLEATNNDFNFILLVSSLIVFLALLISYGRLELTLLAFLPMCVSWVIILGLMAIFDMEFNIVNIILATFIFGIGDDFSIFIMDGLLQEYKNGQKVLHAHKTAIFFSAFTALVGMGVLIFAEHPALRSIALISVLGLGVVVLVSYTLQPWLFRLLIISPTRRGGFPLTLGSIFNTLYCFLYFLLGCVLVQLYALLLLPLPARRSWKKASFHRLVYYFTRFFLRTMVTLRTQRENPYGETYERPAVIIANHQSFIDILLLLSTTPKIVMVTNGWVWNSPFFGRIVRYADFHHTGNGYEELARRLKERVAEGYSVVIFPEGTRSADCSIRRFHKGAFYLASLLELDILPIVIYGAGLVSAKQQGFYIKRGIAVTRTMPRLPFGDQSMGQTYQEQAKRYRKWFIGQYRKLGNKYGRARNPWFRDALIKNYIYKGPVLEWYMRVKCRLDGYYDMWDRMIPHKAVVTDVGCGYGQMTFMLGLLSRERTVLGIDYDSEKIAIARASFLCRGNISFRCDDMRHAEFPCSDAILFNDSLHYVDAATQLSILSRAAASLAPGGIIAVRDGDASHEGHGKIQRTELWSTCLLSFNKTSQELEFATSAMMSRFAEQQNLELTVKSCDASSSETLYIFRRK